MINSHQNIFGELGKSGPFLNIEKTKVSWRWERRRERPRVSQPFVPWLLWKAYCICDSGSTLVETESAYLDSAQTSRIPTVQTGSQNPVFSISFYTGVQHSKAKTWSCQLMYSLKNFQLAIPKFISDSISNVTQDVLWLKYLLFILFLSLTQCPSKHSNPNLGLNHFKIRVSKNLLILRQ